MKKAIFALVGLGTIAAGSAFVTSVVDAAPLPIVWVVPPAASSPTTPAPTYPTRNSKVNLCLIPSGCNAHIPAPAPSPGSWTVVRPTTSWTVNRFSR